MMRNINNLLVIGAVALGGVVLGVVGVQLAPAIEIKTAPTPVSRAADEASLVITPANHVPEADPVPAPTPVADFGRSDTSLCAGYWRGHSTQTNEDVLVRVWQRDSTWLTEWYRGKPSADNSHSEGMGEVPYTESPLNDDTQYLSNDRVAFSDNVQGSMKLVCSGDQAIADDWGLMKRIDRVQYQRASAQYTRLVHADDN